MRNVVHAVVDACQDNTTKENVHNERFINIHLAFLIWKYEVRVWHGEWCLKKMLDFLEIRKVHLFLKKYAEIGFYIYRLSWSHTY